MYRLPLQLLLLGLVLQGQVSFAADPILDRTVSKADMPRIPSTDVDEALSTFKLARGFQLELVAAEPLVGDPVDACFDEYGRMFVAEMHGYPFSHEPTKLHPSGGGLKDAGIIRMLEDTDGDGRMDRSVVYVDQISWPTSLCCYDGGVFVIAPEHLYYFKDTDGDGKADVRDVVLKGFGRGNVQALTNGLKWHLDNRIYFAAGRNPKDLMHRNEAMSVPQSSDLRFDPRSENFEPVTGGLQFGHSMDDWGTRFVCSNSNHIMQVIYPQEYLGRNPFLAVSSSVQSIAADGASARVFRISPPEPWRIVRQKWRAADKGYKLVINDDGGWEFLPLSPTAKKGVVPTEYPVGFFTSATGTTIYRGNAYPKEYRGNAFIGDVGGNLIHRKTLDTSGVVYRADRADEGVEIVASTDNWFRPVNFVNAPDGTLYVLDMYRETIEHPHSIPEQIKKFLDLTSGRDRGRIYRLVSPNMKRLPVVRIGDLQGDNLVAELASENSWNRETAQRIIWERGDKSLTDAIAALLQTSSSPLGRMHALYALDGLGTLSAEHLEIGLHDSNPRVRAHAVRLSEPMLNSNPKLLDSLVALCDDPNDHVRFQLAFSLGQTEHADALQGLTRLLRAGQSNAQVQTAVMSSVGKSATTLAAALIEDPDFSSQPHAVAILVQLATMIGTMPENTKALELLASASSEGLAISTREKVLSALSAGLGRRGQSVPKLLATETIEPSVKKRVDQLFLDAKGIAADDSVPTKNRETAIRLLAMANSDLAVAQLQQFLDATMPQSLQLTAARSLARLSSDQSTSAVLAGWRGFSPLIRRDVVDALLSTERQIHLVLDALEAKRIGLGDIERDKKQFLLSHPKRDVRARSEKLFAGQANSNRARVVAEHQAVLRLEGNVEHGLQVFKKKCAVCHQVGDVGHAVAPELTSVKNKSADDLLIAILDPNRESQPAYNTYVVQTIDGRVLNGMIAAESSSSITLRRAEAKEDVVLRTQIDALSATGVSLMPEGLEEDLKHQDLADVISYIKSIKSK